MVRCVLSLLIPAFSLLATAQAQFVQQGNKLVGTGAAGTANQGWSVSVSADGNTAIVGGFADNQTVGAAWIYVRTSGVWLQQGPKLVGVDAVGHADQGYSVSVSADGNTVIVGGSNDNNGAGAAWVYVRANGVWSQQGPKLVGAGAVGAANQGNSVSISADGNTALVGGPEDSSIAGAAWVFTRINGVWSQQGSKLLGLGAVGNAQQGYSVALSADGNTAILGGTFDNGMKGAAWVFNRTNGLWNQQGNKLVGIDGSAGPAFQGRSVALSADGNTALVGGDGEAGAGGARVYVRASGVWAQQGPRLVGSGAAGNAQQGYSVSLSADGTTALVSGWTDNNLAGAVWTFGRANGLWTQQGGKLVGTGAVGNAYQGFSASLSGDGNTAVVGGPFDNGSAGGAWVYARAVPHILISTPASVTAGVPFTFAVVVVDASNSIATGYTGMVHFSSSDPLAILPFDSFVSNGGGTFSATLKTGNFITPMITAADTVNSSISGTSPPIEVLAADAAYLQIFAPASVIAGVPFLIDVSPRDQFGNFQPHYFGSLRFTSSDGTAILPPPALQTNFGVLPAAGVVLKGAGNQTITVTDTVNASITGTSTPILVGASTNLALGKKATQSSTLPGYPFATAGSALDGSTDGNFFNQSVTATNLENSPWWQVDLGNSATIASIVIWNRTDCCGIRLNDYWVFVSDVPFGPADTPSTLQFRAGTWSSHQSSAPNPFSIIAAGNTIGRFVRVQLSDTNYLSLAEVQLLSGPAPDWDLAKGKVATQSSTLSGYATAGPGSAVDGNTDGILSDGSVTATNLDTEPWWQVDLGVETRIDDIVIHNRTDCCADRLGDYYVFVSDAPFNPADTILALQGRPGVLWMHETGAPNPSAVFGLGTPARYIRVQIPGSNYLSLAEVQVSGAPNLAEGKAATQSSTLSGYPTAGAAAAVDGNTDGSFFNGSVTATNLDSNAWWQVDLGASATIEAIDIFNRTDCCSSRLSNYWVFVSDTPFAPSDTPSTLQSRPGTWGYGPINGEVGMESLTVPGRYVRIQLSGTGYLSLAEVRVYGTLRAGH